MIQDDGWLDWTQTEISVDLSAKAQASSLVQVGNLVSTCTRDGVTCNFGLTALTDQTVELRMVQFHVFSRVRHRSDILDALSYAYRSVCDMFS